MMQSQNLSVGVVIPVRDSQRTIRQAVESILNQDYVGPLTIWIVGNVADQDNTWSACEDLTKDSRVHCVKILRPANWDGRDANLKRFWGCKTAIEAGVDIIAFTDSQVFVPIDWISKSVSMLTEYRVDGVAGISCRHSQDRSLFSVYQDSSLISEWPRYGPQFFLSRDTFGKANGLPITANLVISRVVFEHVRGMWPEECKHGWDDFFLIWRIVLSGFTILCTDKLLCMSQP